MVEILEELKLVELNYQLIFADLFKSTLYNILLYMYLYLTVISINKPREFPRGWCKTEVL